MPINEVVDEAGFWLLDVAVEGQVWLQVLKESRDVIHNRWLIVHHGMERDELTRRFISLHRQSYIYCYKNEPKNTTHGDCCLTHAQVVQAVAQADADVYYGLTQLGGQIWERAAIPNWELFFSDLYSEDIVSERASVDVECGSVEQLQRIHKCLPHPGDMVLKPISDLKPRFLTPWQATYWKTLPFGVAATLEYSSEIPTVERDRELADFCQGFRRWRAFGLSRETSWNLFATYGC
jgi:hypothetical protein